MKILPTAGRVIVRANLEIKNFHKLTDDITIRLERKVDNTNGRYFECVQGWVVCGDGLPEGVEVVCSHLTFHPTNEIFDHDYDLGEDEKLYSIPVEEVYAWHDKASYTWKPCSGFLLVEQVFKPYNGSLIGILPEPIKNNLFVVAGNHLHKVLLTGNWCFYTVIFQGASGREERLSRMRDSSEGREEVLGILDGVTEQVLNGELLIGETPETACTFQEYMKNKNANAIQG